MKPLTVAHSQSRRFTISAIQVQARDFLPFALALAPPAPASASAPLPAQLGASVYWSDLATHQINRCFLAGQNFEIVATNVCSKQPSCDSYVSPTQPPYIRTFTSRHFLCV